MRMAINYMLNIAFGCALFYSFGWLTGLAFPAMKLPIFISGSVWWIWVAYKHSKARKASDFEVPSEFAERLIGNKRPRSEKVSSGKPLSASSNLRAPAHVENKFLLKNTLTQFATKGLSIRCIANSGNFLGKNVADVAGLTDYQDFEKNILLPASVISKGEDIKLAENVTYLDRDWQVSVGIIRGEIYKVVYKCTFKDKEDSIRGLSEIMEYMEENLNLKDGDKTSKGVIQWAVCDGFAVMQLQELLDEMFATIFVVSTIGQHARLAKTKFKAYKDHVFW